YGGIYFFPVSHPELVSESNLFVFLPPPEKVEAPHPFPFPPLSIILIINAKTLHKLPLHRPRRLHHRRPGQNRIRALDGRLRPRLRGGLRKLHLAPRDDLLHCRRPL